MKKFLTLLILINPTAFGMARLAIIQANSLKSRKTNVPIPVQRFTTDVSNMKKVFNEKCPYGCTDKFECHKKIEIAIQRINFAYRRLDRAYSPFRVSSDIVEEIENAGCDENKKIARIYSEAVINKQ